MADLFVHDADSVEASHRARFEVGVGHPMPGALTGVVAGAPVADAIYGERVLVPFHGHATDDGSGTTSNFNILIN